MPNPHWMKARAIRSGQSGVPPVHAAARYSFIVMDLHRI